MDKEKALAKVRLFSTLEARQLRSLAAICVEKRFTAGDTLMEQGRNGVGLYILMEGKAKVVRTDAAGHATQVAECGPGEILGEMAVLDGAPRSASVIAIEPTVCLVLTSWEFNAFIKTTPSIALEILPVVVKRFREASAALQSAGQPST
jgi:CRP/FNR family cyclic AMP-dependent transcriptional regulator